MAKIVIKDSKGKKVDNLELNDKLFNGKVNKALLQQVVTMYLANQRKSFAKVKDRSEVRGGGKKPWRQKGTGRARAGSIRSPLWRSGGVVFGPKAKDWYYKVPKNIRRQALTCSLNAKLNEESITVIDEFKLDSHKTKGISTILKDLKLSNDKVVIISGKTNANMVRAAKNISNVDCVRAEDINAYQILVSDKVLLEKEALTVIEKRLSGVVSKKREKSAPKAKAV